MAHYAFLDENNVVTEVIVGRDENELGIDWEEWYGNFRNQICKRTSYNTSKGEHTTGGIPYRKNYAGIGFIYDEQLDGFIPPKEHSAWILNEETCNWEPPFEGPDDDKNYRWNDNINDWEPYIID